MALATGALPLQDPQPDLKSKDPVARLAAVKAIVEGGGEDAEKTLLRALKDDDWEVALVATRGLGRHGSDKSLDPLVEMACEGPVRLLRAAAAESLALLDPAEAVEELGKELKRDGARAACQALVRVAPRLGEAVEPPKALAKLCDDDDLRLRAAAGAARVALMRAGRGELLQELLASEHLALRASALEVCAQQPHAEQVPPLLELLGRSELDDVLLRRALPAFVAGVDLDASTRAEQMKEALASLCTSEAARVARRGPLLAEATLVRSWAGELDLVELTAGARDHDEPGVRAGAARLLGLLQDGRAAEAARIVAEQDASERVRRAALEARLRLRPVTEEETRGWLVERLEREGSRELREEIVVALGHPELAEDAAVAEALIAALADREWRVAACAAVSLGITRSPAAVEPLAKLSREAEDWRLRGAAVVGLAKSFQKPAVEAVIAALEDTEPLVAKSAHTYLLSIARGAELAAEVALWTEWWEREGPKLRLLDPLAQQERNRKYDYEAPPEVIYRGLDVVVLESRGDRIQVLLERLGIDHRLTMSSRVAQDGLDAAGVFVANCTGELEPGDVERIEWFVAVGGYLCGSCWALTETIERIAPGVLSKVVTRDEVLDDVEASPCSADSPYLRGVFGEEVVPLYHLEGSHLVRVLQPERVEMLVDSAECAEKWGGGNLACWFRSGHGTILDSANHFHSQGFESAQGLKKAEERQAFAVDHLGASLQRIRETRKAKFWGSNHKAAEEILDYSVFRLVTNFVRLRRLEGR